MRLFAGEVAAGVQRIDAYVEQWAAAGELFIGAPFVRAHVEAEAAFDGLYLAESAVMDHADGLEVGGLVVAAVGDHELHVGGFAGGNHLLTIGHIGGHGLLAQHVLAGLCGADGVFGVHGVGQRHVDRVHVGVVRDLVEVLVVIDRSGGHAVVRGDAVGFVAMAANQSGDPRVGGETGGGQEVVGDSAEADDGVVGLLLSSLRAEARCEVGGKAEGSQFGEVSAGDGHVRRTFQRLEMRSVRTTSL